MENGKNAKNYTRWIDAYPRGATKSIVDDIKAQMEGGKTVKIICRDDQVEILKKMGIPEECIQTVEREMILQIPDPIVEPMPTFKPYELTRCHHHAGPQKYEVIIREMAIGYYLGKIGIKEDSNYIDCLVSAYVDEHKADIFLEMYNSPTVKNHKFYNRYTTPLIYQFYENYPRHLRYPTWPLITGYHSSVASDGSIDNHVYMKYPTNIFLRNLPKIKRDEGGDDNADEEDPERGEEG